MTYSNPTSSEPFHGFEYTYDEAGNMVKESRYSYYKSNTMLSSYKEYEYWGNKKVKEKIYDGDVRNLELSQYTDYTYVGDKLVKEEKYMTHNNSLFYAWNYEYDERSNLIRKYKYEPNHGITDDMEYFYDDQNRLILDIEHRYTYDDSGRLIKTEYLNDDDSSFDYSEQIYNGTDKTPEKTLYYDKNGNFYFEHIHFYDEWGNLVESLSPGRCPSFKRKYYHDLLIEEFIYYSIGYCAEGGITRYIYEKR